MPWSLRPITRDDLPKIVEIEARAYSGAGIVPWSLENFEGEILKPFSGFLVLTDDETDSELAGYIVYWLLLGEVQILNVAVDIPYRRNGFAKKMIRQVINEAARNNVKKILLDVRKTNASALELYQSLNFTVTHVRKGFYSNGDDAYQMTLEMDSEIVDF